MPNAINRHAVNSHLRVGQYHKLMTEQWVRMSQFDIPSSSEGDAEAQSILVNPTRDNPTDCPPIPSSTAICLNLESLRPFESVEDQFQHCGIIFHNAIALHPSNTAYPPHSGTIVLMGAPKNGWMEINFPQPIGKFICYATSSQRILLSAYDAEGNLLVQDDIPASNLAGSDSHISPNAPLQAVSANISRITLYALDGQLTIDDISFWV